MKEMLQSLWKECVTYEGDVTVSLEGVCDL